MNPIRLLRRRFSTSLLTQGMAATIALHTTSACLLLGLFLLVQDRALERQLELRGEAMAGFLSNEVQFGLLVSDREEIKRVLAATLSDEDVLFLEVRSPSGERLCSLGRSDLLNGIRPPDPAAYNRTETAARRGAEAFVEVRVPVLSPNRDRLFDWQPSGGSRSILGVLRMGISMRKQHALLRGMLLGGVFVILFGLAAMCGAQYWGLRRMLLPLEALVGFTRLVGTGDLRQHAPVGRGDEIGQLAAAFNAMVERLGETTVSKEYLDNILHSMGEALVVTTAAGSIRHANPRALELLGYPAQELLGRPAVSLLAEGAAPSRTTGIERTYLTRDGRLIPVWFSSAELRDASLALTGHVWLAQDMTEIKRIQAELTGARDAAEQASHAKSTFLANMSHELRTPLNAIIGYSQMLAEDYIGPEQEEVLIDLAKIERSGQHLLGIINDILDLSKIEAGRETVKLQHVDVARVLEDVRHTVAPLARRQHNTLEIHCPDEARLAFADLAKFRQSVLNLVNNALKFTENGRVTVSVNRLRYSQGDWTEVHVADTGIGISPEHLHRLFQPFSQVDGSATRRYEGTGLGLAISQKFCQMMGGGITVESEPGRGSRFSIRIPTGPDPALRASEV